MLRSLYTAATGMEANQLFIDNISNNLSNVNTTGFKTSKLEFEDLLYQTLVPAGASNADGAKSPAGLQVGLGVKSSADEKIFSQGALQQTSNPLDLAIQGDGFFQVQLPSGDVAYTRDGTFKTSADGTIVTSQGYPLEPPIVIPDGATNVTIGADGKVSVTMSDTSATEEIGQLQIAKFINEGGLSSMGQNLYATTPATGDPEVDAPGQNGLGSISQGYVEASNVQLVSEMVNMIVAQRAYEISSKAIQTSDSMMQIANQLKS